MRVDILTNSLLPGDAVSAHCLQLRRHCLALGHQARIVAPHADSRLAGEIVPPAALSEPSAGGDILLYQFFHFSPVSCWADTYPGHRVMMYHNITPPEMAGTNDRVRRECELGLRQLNALAPSIDMACGMSEFSRGDLEKAGYRRTEVFPLLIDTGRLDPPQIVSPRSPVSLGARFVFLGRLAPNKRQDRLLRLLAEWKRFDPEASITLIGDDGQHPEWRTGLSSLCRQLGLREGSDAVFTGKVSDGEVRRILLESDVFVSASGHEGFGAPLIEAMAFGLPVFAVPEAAVEGTLDGAGHLLRDDSERQWAEEIRRVLDHSPSRWALHAAQGERLERFTDESARRQVAELLEKAASLPPRLDPNPRVSVVINTYNRDWWLDRCLASLQRQTYTNFEVTVVNGPSTDKTAEVLNRWKDRLKAVQTESRVLSVSRNEGIAASSGELVAFIDDDAVADPHWLERLVPAFLDPATGGAGGLVYRMNGRDIEFSCGTLDRDGFVEWNRPQAGAHFDWQDGRLNTVSGNNCIFRRAALDRIGGFDERIEYYHDEADVVWRLERAGFHIAHRPNAIVYHEAARSQNRTGRHNLNWYAIVKNTVYCALKNYTGPKLKAAAAASIIRRVHRERIADIGRWKRQGEISGAEAMAYRKAAWQGIAVGLHRGWLGLERTRAFHGDAEAPFLPFDPKPERLAVCLLSQSLPWVRPGGIATYTWELARGLAAEGCRVHVVSADAEDPPRMRDGVWLHRPAEPELPPGVSLEPGLAVTSKNVAYSWAVHRTVADIDARFGLQLVESPNWDAEGLVTAIDGRLPVAVRAHSPLFEVAGTQGWTLSPDLQAAIALEQRLVRNAVGITGSTKAILDLAAEGYRVGRQRMTRIPLGIGVSGAGTVVEADGNADPLVLFAGRLEPRKGIETLLVAIESLLDKESKARYVLAGDDAEGVGKAWLEKLRWRKPALARRVELGGRVSEKRLSELYRECSLFVAPSLWESFGLVFLEAMANGKPVIGTTAGGIPEVVEDGRTGVLVHPGDAKALAAAILSLLGDPKRRKAMGQAGHERWKSRFSARAMARATLDHYRRLAASWQPATGAAYRASAAEMLRTAESKVVWSAAHGCLAIASEGTGWRTIVYGPYMTLPAGAYRASFLLWTEGETEADEPLARVEAFCGAHRYCESVQVTRRGLTPGSGGVANVFFHLEEPMADFEFRVHACSGAAVFFREIQVIPWPGGGRASLIECEAKECEAHENLPEEAVTQ